MKRLQSCALASVLVFMGVATASAQSPNPVGVAARIGLVFPTDTNVTNNSGTTWFGFGAEYTILHLDPTSATKPTLAISADYFSRNSLTETPVLLNLQGQSNGFFASVGAGVSFVHVPGNSSSKFGYQVGVGYNLPITEVPLFLEVKYWGTQDTAYNAVGVYLGVRF